MLRFFAAVPLAVALAACSPTFDWREVTVPSTGLKAQMPCKPESAQRQLELSPGREVQVRAFGCEAGSLAFAILSADVKEGAALAPALAQWRAASLAGLHGTASGETAFVPTGAIALPQSVQLRASGRRPDGRAVESRAAYFARGTVVFQAVVYAQRIDDTAADTFFAGLRFE